ncbi:MAG TPA: cache domain-containing protein, partial [Polyangiales bacterium]|nr:cache domain-containing protein [Polyangiales bacterium]
MAEAEASKGKRKPSGGARAWGAMITGVAAVVAIGGAAFFGHAAARSGELEAHYDREAARTASQVAARWETVVKRLAPLAELDNEHLRVDASSSDDVVRFEPCPAEVTHEHPLQTSHHGVLRFVRAADKLCARISFETLLEGPRTSFNSRRDRARRFDQLFLTDAKGNVLAGDRSAPQLQANELTFLASKEPKQVQLGTTPYRAFVRTVPQRLEAPDALPALSVYGLVEAGALAEDGRRVESSYALLGMFMIVMSIICLPAAKLWLVGPYVRYRRFDVGLFHLASVVGITLSFILLLGLVARESLRAGVDEQLRAVADKLADEIGGRIAHTAQALDRFDRTLIPGPTSPHEARAGDDCLARKATTDLALPEAWNVVFAIDANGKQRGKLFRDQETACVDVSERDYFKKVSKGKTRNLLRPLDGASDIDGSVEIVRSLTTGKVVLIAARAERPSESALAGTAQAGSLALEIPVDELTRQILPRGIQTAVLDARGRVMLHSDVSVVSQQFFDDLDQGDAERLRASIDGERRASLDVQHLGVPSRLYIEPLQAGWTVIALAPNELIDVPMRRILLITSAICLLVLALLVLTLAALRPAAERLRSWLRGEAPAPRKPTLPGYYEAVRNSHIGIALARPLAKLGALTISQRPASDPPSSFPARIARLGRMVTLSRVSAFASIVAGLAFAYAYARVGEYEVRMGLQERALQDVRHAECDRVLCLDLTSYASTPGFDPPTLRAGVLDPVLLPLVELVVPDSHRLDRAAFTPDLRTDGRSLPWSYMRTGAGISLEHAGRSWYAELPRAFDALHDLSRVGAFTFVLLFAAALVASSVA